MIWRTIINLEFSSNKTILLHTPSANNTAPYKITRMQYNNNDSCLIKDEKRRGDPKLHGKQCNDRCV